MKTYTVREEYVYDHASRLRFTRHKINTNNWVVTSAPVYDELDRLADKRLHASNYDGTSAVTLASNFNYLQSLDYTYNIRGWLTGINDIASCVMQDGDQVIDMFKMQLSYDVVVNSGTAQFNGNISSMQWRTSINGTCLDQQQFRFSYDAANRLLAADHKTHNGTSWQNTDRYKESGIGYDLNGNIKTYIRDGWLSGSSYGNIDFLTYTYDTNIPDRLVKVVDNGSQTKGFKYLPNLLGNHYFYDNNGNLTQDRHKNLNFDYNYLNLPDSIFITGSSYISITHTADGEKLKKVSPTETRNYVAGIEYLGANLEAIYHAEGLCTPNGATAFHYEYTLRDHLGNARVNFRANGTAVTFLEEMHYYPFGMLMEGIGTAAVTVNKYKYNGKELNDDLGLNLSDYGARWYDAALGRWWSVDPLGEIAPNWTPYRYGFNNPILFFDQFGAFETKKEAKKYAKEHGIKTGWFRDNKIVKQKDGTYSIDNKKEGSSTYNDPDWGGVVTAALVVERGVHLRDIGIDGFNDLSDPYSGTYNPNAVVFTDGLDIAYAIGSYLSLASPTGRTVKAGQAAANTAKEVVVKSKTVLGHIEDGYIEVAKKLGANYFNPQKWSKAANQEFLDQVIARGDDVILTRPISDIVKGRVLDWEVQYLLKNGYKELNPTTLVKQ